MIELITKRVLNTSISLISEGIEAQSDVKTFVDHVINTCYLHTVSPQYLQQKFRYNSQLLFVNQVVSNSM